MACGLVDASNFIGADKQALVIPWNTGSYLVLVGVGQVRPDSDQSIGWLSLGGLLGKAVAKMDKDNPQGPCRNFVALFAERDEQRMMDLVARGCALGQYRYSAPKMCEFVPELGERLVEPDGFYFFKSGGEVTFWDALEDGLDSAHGSASVDGVTFARNLTNAPPNHKRPGDVISLVREWYAGHKSDERISCAILGKKELKRMWANLILAVNAGSSDAPAHQPYLIHITIKPAGKEGLPKVALVGKGITYDAGGLGLKPDEHQHDMKLDVGGAATALGVACAAAQDPEALHCELSVIVVLTENLLGPDAMKFLDVYRGLDGRLTQVDHTDAEGRLILSDGNAYAANQGVNLIINLATMTGGQMVALGRERSALFTRTKRMAEYLSVRAGESGEGVWHMPLDWTVAERLDISDDPSTPGEVQNLDGKEDSPGQAAAFLEAGIPGDTNWAYLDIAGPAFMVGNTLRHHLPRKGATGTLVMSLHDALCDETFLDVIDIT